LGGIWEIIFSPRSGASSSSSSGTAYQQKIFCLRGSSCLADLGRTVKDPGEGTSKDRRQVLGLVATWWLEPSCGVRRVYAEQAVQLRVDIHDLVVIVMGAD